MAAIVSANVTASTNTTCTTLVAEPVWPRMFVEHEHRDEDADHEDVAVGEVDELDDPVDHRVAEGDEGVDRADRQGVDELSGPEDEEHDDRQGRR